MPIEMVPDYPADAEAVILTAQAGSDVQLAAKMRATIQRGGNVFVTSGLIQVAEDQVSEIVELKVKKNMLVNNFQSNVSISKDILVKQIGIRRMTHGRSYPREGRSSTDTLECQ